MREDQEDETEEDQEEDLEVVIEDETEEVIEDQTEEDLREDKRLSQNLTKESSPTGLFLIKKLHIMGDCYILIQRFYFTGGRW